MKKLPKSTALRSQCPVATTLDVVGDKWSLLIIRDIGVFGRHRNKEFQEGSERIPSNLLADRLKTLHSLGIIKKKAYQQRPLRFEYHLTPVGEQLLPVVRAMAQWSVNNVAGVRVPDGMKQQASD